MVLETILHFLLPLPRSLRVQNCGLNKQRGAGNKEEGELLELFHTAHKQIQDPQELQQKKGKPKTKFKTRAALPPMNDNGRIVL